jgi:hypothetical protein
MTVNECKERVVRAATAWVNYCDTGSVQALHRETKLRQRLAAAVTGYERALCRLVIRRKKLKEKRNVR